MGFLSGHFGVILGRNLKDLLKFCFRRVLYKETLTPLDLDQLDKLEKTEESENKLLLYPYSDIDLPSVLECDDTIDSIYDNIILIGLNGFTVKNSKLDNLTIRLDTDYGKLILSNMGHPPIVTSLSQLQNLSEVALYYRDAGRCTFEGNDPKFSLVGNQ